MHGGKAAKIALAAYRACHQMPKNDEMSCKYGDKADETRVFLNGAVGDDELGPPLRAGLEEEGINVARVHILPGEKTGRVVVMVQRKHRQSSSLGFKIANILFQRLEDRVEYSADDPQARPDILITHRNLRLMTVENLLEIAYANEFETILSASLAVYLESAT